MYYTDKMYINLSQNTEFYTLTYTYLDIYGAYINTHLNGITLKQIYKVYVHGIQLSH